MNGSPALYFQSGGSLDGDEAGQKHHPGYRPADYAAPHDVLDDAEVQQQRREDDAVDHIEARPGQRQAHKHGVVRRDHREPTRKGLMDDAADQRPAQQDARQIQRHKQKIAGRT